MRWTWLVLVTFAAACGAVPGGTETRAPDAATARDGAVAPQAVRAAGRRRAEPPAERTPDVDTETEAAPDAPDAEAETGTLVRGRVVDGAGTPLAKAHVVAFLGFGQNTATTDADGHFAIAVGEPNGAVRCLAWADDHAVAVGPWCALRDGDQADTGTLRCGPAARIDGRLVGPDGANVRGRVSIESASAFDDETLALLRDCLDLDRIDVESCSCGTCDKLSIRFLPAGRYVLRADDGGEPVTVDAPADDVRVPAPPRGPWTFDVEVRVLDWDGARAAGHVLRAVPRYDWHHVTQSWRTDEDSATLRASCDESSSVEIVAEMPDGRRASQEVYAGDAESESVELRLPRYAASERRSIRGTVTFGGRPVGFTKDPSGEMHGTRVRVSATATGDDYGPGYSKATTTNADGTFEIDGLDPGEYALWAQTDDTWGDATPLAAARAIADSGRDDVVIEMPVSSWRRFRVTLPTGFGAIDDYDARVEGPDGDDDSPDAELTGDELLVTGLRADVAYSLWLRVRSGATWTRPARVAPFTAGAETLCVRVETGLRITGRIVRPDGTPVIASNVWLERDDADGDHDTYTDLDGRFTIAGLEPGRWTLKASAPGLWAGDEGVVVEAGTENFRVRLDIER